MSVPLPAALDRIVSIQKEIMVSLGQPANAVKFASYTQDQYPFWTNRVGRFTTPSLNEDMDFPVYDIIMRLVIGHETEGYEGDLENQLATWIPQIVEYFHNRPRLQNDDSGENVGLSYLQHAQIVSGTGLRLLQNFGSIGAQVGCEFTLQLEFVDDIDLEYG